MEFLKSQDARIVVGDCTYGQPKFMIWEPHERITIGKFCSIAEGVTIFAGGEHRLDWISTYPMRIMLNEAGAHQDGHPHTKGPTVIGNDVWLGFGSTVLSGVTIGHGAVVGAGAVVARDVEPYSIVAGNPARLVRARLDAGLAKRLLAVAWWDWPLETIRQQIGQLNGSIDEGRLQALERVAETQRGA